MRNFEELGRELERRGKTRELRALAESEDGVKLAAMLDGAGFEQAAKAGDGEALRAMLGTLLASKEGKRLAEQVRRMMGS